MERINIIISICVCMYMSLLSSQNFFGEYLRFTYTKHKNLFTFDYSTDIVRIQYAAQVTNVGGSNLEKFCSCFEDGSR